MRLDVCVAARGFSASRTEAQSLIREGQVRVNGTVRRQPAYPVTEADMIEVLARRRYVSRGGLKLEAALKHFGVDPLGQVCMDIGASTGGFTDCLLQHGALRVYAVENGHGQLAPSLLSDPRVVNCEGYHAKQLSRADFPELPTLYVMDVSFISQTVIMPSLAAMMPHGARLISLIKPQFEAGRRYIGARGIVTEEAGRRLARERVLDAARSLSLIPDGEVIPSPITGGDGNIEYLICFTKREA